MSLIRRNLFLGSQEDATNPDFLKKNNISNILNVAFNSWTYNKNINYKKLNILDFSITPIAHYFTEAFEFIDKCLDSNQAVLVHCRKGKSRSATIIIAYLMLREKLSYQDALSKVKRIRNVVQPNFGFEKQLLIFENVLKEYFQKQAQSFSVEDDYKLLNELIQKGMINFKATTGLTLASVVGLIVLL